MSAVGRLDAISSDALLARRERQKNIGFCSSKPFARRCFFPQARTVGGSAPAVARFLELRSARVRATMGRVGKSVNSS
jgi:hypothetical protein